MKKKTAIMATALRLLARVVSAAQIFTISPAYVALPVQKDPTQGRRLALLHKTDRRRQQTY